MQGDQARSPGRPQHSRALTRDAAPWALNSRRSWVLATGSSDTFRHSKRGRTRNQLPTAQTSVWVELGVGTMTPLPKQGEKLRSSDLTLHTAPGPMARRWVGGGPRGGCWEQSRLFHAPRVLAAGMMWHSGAELNPSCFPLSAASAQILC